MPRANGQVERINRTIIPVLTKMSIDDPTKWYKHVLALQQKNFDDSVQTIVWDRNEATNRFEYH